MCYDFEVPEKLKPKSKNAINKEEEEEEIILEMEPMIFSN
jgi:hypothetical protein